MKNRKADALKQAQSKNDTKSYKPSKLPADMEEQRKEKALQEIEEVKRTFLTESELVTPEQEAAVESQLSEKSMNLLNKYFPTKKRRLYTQIWKQQLWVYDNTKEGSEERKKNLEMVINNFENRLEREVAAQAKAREEFEKQQEIQRSATRLALIATLCIFLSTVAIAVFLSEPGNMIWCS